MQVKEAARRIMSLENPKWKDFKAAGKGITPTTLLVSYCTHKAFSSSKKPHYMKGFQLATAVQYHSTEFLLKAITDEKLCDELVQSSMTMGMKR